jgi:hypothetical protein
MVRSGENNISVIATTQPEAIQQLRKNILDCHVASLLAMTIENNYSQSFISPLQNGEGQGGEDKNDKHGGSRKSVIK